METNPSTLSLAALLDAARSALGKAYAPYSQFRVGAALQFRGNERIFTGCNVENASYGATVCAERSAILGGISALGGRPQLERVAVMVRGVHPAPPCALCLQVMAEFAHERDFPVYLASTSGALEEVLFSQLLPRSFRFEPGSA